LVEPQRGSRLHPKTARRAIAEVVQVETLLLNTAESGVERISAKILVVNVHTSDASSSAPDRIRERNHLAKEPSWLDMVGDRERRTEEYRDRRRRGNLPIAPDTGRSRPMGSSRRCGYRIRRSRARVRPTECCHSPGRELASICNSIRLGTYHVS
jgi:hypothetical protein